MTPAADLERLLAHADWIRALARRLAGSAADDVVQDTYLAAMQSPPDRDRPAKPWLARVVANASRMRFRAESRRARREDRAASDAATLRNGPSAATGATGVEHSAGVAMVDAADAPDVLVTRLETHRALVDLVLALDEPFRATIIRHYFNGATLAEIARSDGVPEGTVRWRHARAVERLRASLDERAGGDRRAWVVALVTAPKPAATGTALVIGGVVVNKIVIAVVLVIAGVIVWQLHARSSVPSSSEDSAAPGSSISPSPSSERASSRVVKLAPDERRRVVERIATARANRQSSSAAAAHSASSGPAPTLPAATIEPVHMFDKSTIRDAMHEVIAMLADCYSDSLSELGNRGIKIVARLTLDGDPDVGTIVDAKQLFERDGPALPSKLDDCLRSTFQSIELPPLAEGDHVEVAYPFVFNPAPTAP